MRRRYPSLIADLEELKQHTRSVAQAIGVVQEQLRAYEARRRGRDAPEIDPLLARLLSVPKEWMSTNLLVRCAAIGLRMYRLPRTSWRELRAAFLRQSQERLESPELRRRRGGDGGER